jgi:hypothetical protein
MAIEELFEPNRRCGLYGGRLQATGAIIEIYTGKSLLHLEGAWLTRLRVDMTPIVETESHITVLLNLKDNNTSAQCMNRSCGNKNGVAWGRDDAIEAFYDRAVGKGLP